MSEQPSGTSEGSVPPAVPPPASEDQKPSIEHINLKVVDQEGQEVFFKIKRTTPLSKLMNAYCDRQGKDQRTVRFLVDGERLRPTETPESMQLEDGDVIEAVLEQLGGLGRM